MGATGTTPQWTVEIPDSSDIYQNVFFDKVQQTLDGGYVFIGHTNMQTTDYAVTYPHLYINGYEKDLIVVKYSSTGQFLWKKAYGGLSMDRGIDIKNTPDGGYICLGYTMSFNENLQACPMGAGFGLCGGIWLFKINEIGDMQWQKRLANADTLSLDIPTSFCTTTDGGYLISAVTSADAGCDPTSHFSIIKTNGQGTELWQTDLPTLSCWAGGNTPYFVENTDDGGFIATGEYGSDTGSTFKHIFIVKGNSNGVIEWTKKYDRGRAMLLS